MGGRHPINRNRDGSRVRTISADAEPSCVAVYGGVKALLVGTGALLLGVAVLPAVLFGGDETPPAAACAGGAVDADQLAVILATIRYVETGGNYQTRVRSSSASGAYAFIDAAWRDLASRAGVDTATYPSAWMAPAPDQDATASLYVNEILADHDGRIEIIPIAWYLPSAIGNEQKMDQVPPMGANVLTPRQYQARWMAQYEREQARAGHTDTTAASTRAPTDTGNVAATTATSAPTPGGCVGGAITPLPGDWALPGPRAVLDADPDAMDSPHHDYPAWDWIIDADTPIYAVRPGIVVRVVNWPHNWWTQGCGRNDNSGCQSCGVGVTIVDDANYRWTYCHGNRLTVAHGDHVAAGQQVLWSGNTGRSGTAHLHLEIRTNGTQRCPQPLIQSLYHDGVGLDPATLPTTGCSF